MNEALSENLKKYDDLLSGSGGDVERFVLPAGRTLCEFVRHDVIQIKRGEKFCDPKRGESPEDLVPKLVFEFAPCDPKVLAMIPEDQVCDIGFLYSPSFGKKAYLPGFLQGLSIDTKVPHFKKGDGAALVEWLNKHLNHRYLVTHKPHQTKQRNIGVSIAYMGPPIEYMGPAIEAVIAPPKAPAVPGSPRAVADLSDAFPSQLPPGVTTIDDDDTPF